MGNSVNIAGGKSKAPAILVAFGQVYKNSYQR
jgi:hypothetical protein